MKYYTANDIMIAKVKDTDCEDARILVLLEKINGSELLGDDTKSNDGFPGTMTLLFQILLLFYVR
jgi:hypothetical protein